MGVFLIPLMCAKYLSSCAKVSHALCYRENNNGGSEHKPSGAGGDREVSFLKEVTKNVHDN